MQTNKVLLTIGAVILSFVVLFGVYKLVNGPDTNDFPETKTVKATDHIQWSSEKKNIMVEYSDFQCPACKNMHNMFKGFEASASPDLDITKKFTLVYRHYPLYQIHPSSIDASYAAEAAGKQNKFNEMADLLFENQEDWGKNSNPKEYFVNLAKQLSLNIDQFKKDVNSSDVINKVQEDITSGNKLGINQTPTLFVNGRKQNDIGLIADFTKMLRSL